MLDFPKSAIALGGLTLVCFYFFRRRNTPSKPPYPPGPPGLPFVGNAFDLPAKNPWKAYQEWGRKYSRRSFREEWISLINTFLNLDSDVVSVKVFGTRFVVLNTTEATRDLFETRGAIYSSRLEYFTPKIGLRCNQRHDSDLHFRWPSCKHDDLH